MKAFQIFLVCILLILPAAALSATFEVTIDDAGFHPSSLIINIGDTVRWVNKGSSLHSATGGANGPSNGSFDSGFLNPGVSFEHTFNLPGEVKYYDRMDGRLTGLVTADDNKVIISPGSSVLTESQSFDLVIYVRFGERANQHVFPLKITIIFDGVTLYDDFYDNLFIGTDPSSTIRTLDGGSGKKFPIRSLPPGVHALIVKITTASGTVVSDKATYTVLEEGSFSQY